VFPHHTRANECCQLAGHAASRVVPGTLQNHRAFPGNGTCLAVHIRFGLLRRFCELTVFDARLYIRVRRIDQPA